MLIALADAGVEAGGVDRQPHLELPAFVELETMADYRPDTPGRPPVLLLGYAQMPEPSIRTGVHELANAVRAARTRT